MSSLWTPEGEHAVPRRSSGAAEPDAASAAAPGPGPVAGTGEGPELADELAEVERELLGVPVDDVLANHCYGIFQLAALHLGQQPPHLDQARLAIDALGALVDGLGERLGASYPTLVDGLAQIRLAFVQIAGALGDLEPAPER